MSSFASIDVPLITTILRWQRPHAGKYVAEFCEVYLDPIPGMEIDGFGNRILDVGDEAPTTLFSCHVDTVHNEDGFQELVYDQDTETLTLHPDYRKVRRCLGADDGAGIWLMLNLINAGVPGRYIFHQGEECGGLGSSYIAEHHRYRLDGIKRAIAFDRKGRSDLITEMMIGEVCSKEFATEFCSLINQSGKFAYEPCPYGSFTDTANYAEYVPECTNLSVGYDREHGPLESLDIWHLYALRDRLLEIGPDISNLGTHRTPGDFGPGWGHYGLGTYGKTTVIGGKGKDDDAETWAEFKSNFDRKYGVNADAEVDDPQFIYYDVKMRDAVTEYPDAAMALLREVLTNNPGFVAALLEEAGYFPEDITEEHFLQTGR